MSPGIKRLLWLALLAIFAGATLWLSLTRIYQVDEAQTVYMAAVVAQGWKATLFTSGQLHLFPLALLVRPGWSSAQIFTAFRLTFWVLSWVNACLVVVAAGIRLRSDKGLKALVLAGSLAPSWAYALECRHDNILILGVLLLWIVGRRVNAKSRIAVFFGLGVVSLLLQACLFKSIVTWAPASLLLWLVEPGALKRKVALAGSWIAGAVATIAATYGISAWAALGVAATIKRFSPVPALERMLGDAPLLVAAMAVLLVHAVHLLRTHGALKVLEAEGAPEIGLFLVGLLAFFVNPTPFPYNVAVLGSLTTVAVLASGAAWLRDREPRAGAFVPGALYLVVAALVLQVLPLTRRFAELAAMDNVEQESIMAQAEAMTGPDDPVFDAIGMVPTRRAPSFMWFVNLTNVQLFTETSMTRSWGNEIPPIILPSYRFSYLQPQDGEFIRSQYVTLRKDFFALGTTLTQRGTKHWTCQRAGRYAVVPLGGTNAAIRVDGQTLGPGFYDLPRGEHELEADSPALLVWAGPKLQTLPEWQPNQGMPSICPVPTAL